MHTFDSISLVFMDEPEKGNELPRDRRKPRRRWIILLYILLFLVISFFALFFGFNYFGERLLRNYLQDRVRISSNGLYQAGFKTFHVNILTGKVVIDSFELIPDTVQYRRLKTAGRISRALYRVSFASLTIDKVHFRQIYAGKRINFRQMTLLRPVLSIVGFPDTLTAKRSRWRVIYEDLYPAVSNLFNDFHIDSVKVNHGLLLATFSGKTGRKMRGEYEFSSVLRDVSVNPFSYYNPNRVFYSRDIDLVIHNFETRLADSLYLLRAEEIGFSLTRSILYGKKVTLLPNFKSRKIRQVRSGDLFRIELPAFSVTGIDLYRAMTSREVDVSSVDLNDFFIRVYRNKPSPGTPNGNRTKKRITVAGLYTVVAKELRFVAIDSLHLKNGSFEFYGDPSDKTPELRIGRVNLELGQFRLDSLAHLDQSRIFYSRAIELQLERISLNLRDGIHFINASAIDFSTRKSLIDVHEASIFPDRNKNLLRENRPRNTMFINLPRLTFTGIDLKKVFNKRILDFDRLVIDEPEIHYTSYRAAKNPDPRFKAPEDFFESGNEDVVYDLLKKYLWVIRGNEISISRGLIKLSGARHGTEIPLATCSFDLGMQQFLIDSVHGMNEQGYFYSRDFILDLQSVSIVSPDSLRHLQAGRFHVDTRDSLIEAGDIRIYRSAGVMNFNSKGNKKQSLTFDFALQKFQLTGLNHKRLFLDKILKAKQVVLENPTLLLKTSNSLQPAGPPEEARLLLTDNFIRSFEIHRCLVTKGVFSYDGGEDRKASYFSLKDIDFAMVDAMVHLPQKGVHKGLIKFDSLQLKVVPLRAIIADSSYALEAGSLEVHSYPADIILKGIKVFPLKSWKDSPGAKSMATISIPEIRFNGFYFDRALFDNQWLLEALNIDHPSVSVEIRMDGGKPGNNLKINPQELVRFPVFMKTVAVRKIAVTGAKTGLIIHQPDTIRSYGLSGFDLEVTRFRADSASRSNPSGTPLFNADDVVLSLPGYSWASHDSMYTYSIGRCGISTGRSAAWVDSVKVVPNFSKRNFSARIGYQKDRIVVNIPRIDVSGIDFRELAVNRELNASVVTLEGLHFESYRDKRQPFPTWQRPLMPARQIAGIKFPMSIDTIALLDGFVTYEEQSGEEPGRIFFDRVNGTLTGFTTPSGTTTLSGTPSGSTTLSGTPSGSTTLSGTPSGTPSGSTTPTGSGYFDVHSTSRLMGTAPVESWFHFLTGHPRDSFTLRATIGELDLTSLNAMLSKLLPASITRGKATSIEIIGMNGNNLEATGKLNFIYHDLGIQLHPTQPGTWNKLEQTLLTEVVNLLLADNNPDDDGKMKTGIIRFDRDPAKGFFNFVWKSVMSGIKSSVGINSRAQKEMIREGKDQVKERRREEKKQKG